jgi:MerR family transcriptional regulator/heat shock protein HspR
MSIPNDDNIVASDTPVYAISIAAQLCGLHPQTLRQYDRVGLVSAHRVAGRNRLYSARDVQRLRYVSQLSAEGLSIEGIKRVIELEEQVLALREQLGEFHRERTSRALVVWRPQYRNRGQ